MAKFPIMLRSSHEAALIVQRGKMWTSLSQITLNMCKESENRLVEIKRLQKALARKNRRIKKLQEPKT